MWLAHSFTFPGVNQLGAPPYKLRTEDAADWWWAEDALMLAVADGLGEAAMAAPASGLAVAVAKRLTIGRWLFGDRSLESCLAAIRAIYGAVRDDFLDIVNNRNDSPEWQTTLTIVAIIGRDRIAVASVGDATLSIERPALPGAGEVVVNGISRPVTVHAVIPPSGTNVVSTLDSPSSDTQFRLIAVPGCTGVFLSTDGLDQYISHEREPPHRFRVDPGRIGSVFSPLREQRFGDIDQSFGSRVGDKKGDDLGVAMAAWRDDKVG